MSQLESNNPRDKIADAWLAAADDLGIIVTAPFILETGDEQYSFIALIQNFGRAKGTLIGIPDDLETLRIIADEQGYFYSRLYESYETYQRQLFIDTLNDWRWFGDESNKPAWYTGKPWT
jgi:hypothetical protein